MEEKECCRLARLEERQKAEKELREFQTNALLDGWRRHQQLWVWLLTGLAAAGGAFAIFK